MLKHFPNLTLIQNTDGGTLPGAVDGIVAYVGRFDPAELGSTQAWVDAAGQIFYGLSLAVGVMVACAFLCLWLLLCVSSFSNSHAYIYLYTHTHPHSLSMT